MDALYIGIDVGTSGCRAIVIDQNKQIVAQANALLPDSEIKHGHVTQNPAHWWSSCKQVLQNALNSINADYVRAICIDATSGTVMLCNPDGRIISDALMYNDAAAKKEAERIAEVAPVNSGAHGANAGLAKCLALIAERDDLSNIRCLNQADWISGNFLKQYTHSDENNCLKLGYDPVKREWPAWLDSLLPRRILPQVIYPPGTNIGQIDGEIAAEFKLPPDTQIIAGTTDSIAALIAAGSVNIGDAVTSLGSTLAIKLISDKPVFAPEFGIYSHRLGNRWLVGGASNSGGAVLKQFFSQSALDEMSAQLNPEKLTGLNYYPLPSPGERFPVYEPDKQAILEPRPEEDAIFFQAILEGVARIEQLAYKKLAELGAPYPNRIITMGGGSKNEAWCKIREHFCGVDIETADITEAAYGSALLAAQLIYNK